MSTAPVALIGRLLDHAQARCKPQPGQAEEWIVCARVDVAGITTLVELAMGHGPAAAHVAHCKARGLQARALVRIEAQGLRIRHKPCSSLQLQQVTTLAPLHPPAAQHHHETQQEAA